MVNKKNWLVKLVIVFVFGIAIVGCTSQPKERKGGTVIVNNNSSDIHYWFIYYTDWYTPAHTETVKGWIRTLQPGDWSKTSFIRDTIYTIHYRRKTLEEWLAGDVGGRVKSEDKSLWQIKTVEIFNGETVEINLP